MFNEILLAVWFFLPAAVANVTPIFLAKIWFLQRFKKPLDFGKTLRGKSILGKNKSILGLLGGIFFATATFAVQKSLVVDHNFLSEVVHTINYSDLNVLFFGFLFGFGALGGDAIESFFKRQMNIAPGKSWFPFDQIDYILGTILVTYPFIQLEPVVYVLIIGVWIIMHLMFSYIGYLLKLKNNPI